MGMSGSVLASAIASAMGYGSVSAQITAFGNAIVNELQSNAKVAHSVGSITGTCPPSGGALTAGTGSNGFISGINANRIASAIMSAAGYPNISTQLINECIQITTHLVGASIITFSAGSITGTCTNTPSTPGVLSAGAGSGGVLSGLSGSTLASAIHVANGYPGSVSAKLTAKCNAICNHIMSNAVAAYASGSVQGTAPSGGGPLASGFARNGTLS